MSVNLAQLRNYFIQRFELASTQAQIKAKAETLAMCEEDSESAKADAFNVTIKNYGGIGGGTGFAESMRVHSPSASMRWTVSEMIPRYAQITFDRQTLLRATTGALIKSKQSEIDDVVGNEMGYLDFDLWTDRNAVAGRVSAVGGTAAAPVVTLTVAGAYNNFQVGAVYEAWTDAGAGITNTLRSTDSLWRVTGRDPGANTVTFERVQRLFQASAASGVLATTNGGDHLVRYSDRNTTSGGQRLYGIPFFIPAVAPADTVLGVTRTGDPVHSGWRFGYQGSINETIKRSMVSFGRTMDIKGDAIRSKKHVVCVSYDDWYRLEAEADSNVIRDPQMEQVFGAQTLAVNTVIGRLPVKPYVNIAPGRMYGITWSTWCFYRLGPTMDIVRDDGLTMRVLGDGQPGAVLTAGHPAINALGNDNQGDGTSMRFAGYHHFLPKFPAANWTAPTV